VDDDERTPGTEIAIIGMAGRFPGAADLDQLWRRLCHGAELISFFSPAELTAAGVGEHLAADPAYVPAAGVLDGIEDFDADYFACSPREAMLMDPQQRVFLECAALALLDAGCDPARFPGRIGVFGGASAGSYLPNHLQRRPDVLDAVDPFAVQLGNDRDFLATRVSYKLGLRGPSMSVGTACSTSLVAVHLAGQALLTGDADVALAGGVSIRTPQRRGYLHRAGGMMSPDGHCRAFDRRADGTVGGSGAGVVVLKRLGEALLDGDHIHAVVKASAVNNDGAAKAGFTAPSPDGQAEVIAEALAMAGVEPGTIGYVEAHGTGTPMGDPIEVAALSQAFDGVAPGSCALGSIKTNLGHLDVAAGIAGLIKAVYAVRDGLLPPSLHYTEPNPDIDFAAGPFRVNQRLRPWPARPGPRRAGVSSFGVGGTNAHVIVEQPPPVPPRPAPTRRHELLVFSAGSPAALDEMRAGLARHLAAHPDEDLADVAYTLRVGRRIMPYRSAVVCPRDADPARLLAEGEAATGQVPPERPETPVFLLFPGAGARRPGLGRELYRAEPGFRRAVDELAALFRPELGADLAAALSEPQATVPPALAEATLFAVEYALARHWLSWGLRPAGLLGHGVGEWVAACLAGVFTLEDTVALVAARGGPARVAEMPRRPPGIPFVNGVTGAWIAPQEATDAAHWTRPRPAAALTEGLRTVLDAGPAVLLEVGPGRALSLLAGRAGTPEHVPVPTMHGSLGEQAALAAALGRLWCAGVPVDWAGPAGGRRVSLPGYPFQRRRHWVENPGQAAAPVADSHARPALGTPFRAPDGPIERRIAAVWEEQFAVAPIGLDDDFFELGGDSLTAIEIAAKLHGLDPDLPMEAIFETPTVAGLADRFHHPDPR